MVTAGFDIHAFEAGIAIGAARAGFFAIAQRLLGSLAGRRGRSGEAERHKCPIHRRSSGGIGPGLGSPGSGKRAM